MRMTSRRSAVAAATFAGGALVSSVIVIGLAATQAAPDLRLGSRPETVVWGEIPIDRPAALTIRSGDTVAIDTLTHSGATQNENPETYLDKLGIPRREILPDMLDFWASRPERPREGRSGHILTGPIYVEGAEPGDVLEVQVLDLSLRLPWGMNSSSAAGGVLGTGYPGTRPGDPAPATASRIIRTGLDDGQQVAFVTPDVRVPLQPFMGIMAVAPPYPRVGMPGITVDGVQSTRPPGVFGGNLDVKDLGAGSTLYLPVFHKGAQFYTGDPHSVQGDGEVNGTAVEQSLTGRFRFVLHKDRRLTVPRAETATHYLVMGIDIDLDRAMRLAVQEAVDFLVAEKGLSAADAYTLASIGCDFRVSEAVDLTQVVTGHIPKHVFR